LRARRERRFCNPANTSAPIAYRSRSIIHASSTVPKHTHPIIKSSEM
jgi:hypothetical protein